MHRAMFWLMPLWLLCAAVPVRAAEIQWRSDYNTARKEATEKNRPLLIDFGTENCFWCKRLDASTFLDPSVVSLVNEKFVPLKVDAEKEAQLAKSLQITSYPTIVFGSPDGKILGTVVGFKEAPEFLTILQRNATVAPAVPAAPDWMMRDFAEAGKAVATSDYARALTLLKAIVQDGKDRPVQLKARQVMQDIEQQAAGRLARAKQLEDRNQYAEAVDGLTELLRVYPGTTAAQEAGQRLNILAARPEMKGGQRVRRARELLAQAKEDYRTQQYLCCLDRCELLAAHYADLPEGADAVQLASEIKSNPEWMKSACDSLSDRLGLLYLSLADTWLRKGQPQQAEQYLEKIVQCFPGTRQAEAAQVRLSYLKGETTWQADFKKQ
ncbi:MAG: thioredoxin family protein [Planctomycetia bacterium]|nr:thioredoxin family protein [Planctomycetia bacterium]